MTEPQGEYNAGETVAEPTGPTCPECHTQFGKYGTDGPRWYVMTETGFWYSLHGYCKFCGHEIHWSDNEERLARLMRRMTAK